MYLKVIFFVLLCTKCVLCWDSEQMEVFDLVEEIKQNFYELLNITQDASNKEIRSAFKALSLKLHPDKNLQEDTNVQFRNLVSVYEVLKSPTKRQYYDEVLVNGLPNWKSAVYYYRHVRKLGLAETCVILTLFISLGQYLVGWASYLEQKYTFEQTTKRKRRDKDVKYEFELPKPSLKNTLPIQIPCLLWWAITGLPHAILQLKTIAAKKLDEAVAPPPPPPVKIEEVQKPPRGPRKRKPGFVPPEGPNFELAPAPAAESRENTTAAPPVSGGLWTDDDLSDLVQLVNNKFPAGTAKRWERIAEELGRSVAEVTFMANKIKSNSFKIGADEEQGEEQPRVKQKTRVKTDELGEEGAKKWSQPQQRALEEALARFPKGCSDRWDRIGECVPEKSKEECMLRYRFLAESVRKQKEEPQTPAVD